MADKTKTVVITLSFDEEPGKLQHEATMVVRRDDTAQLTRFTFVGEAELTAAINAAITGVKNAEFERALAKAAKPAPRRAPLSKPSVPSAAPSWRNIRVLSAEDNAEPRAVQADAGPQPSLL